MTTEWIKASASGGDGGQCVEVRQHAGAVQVRDSKDKTGPVLTIAPRAFAAFVSAAAAGELNHLA